jgi:hypothetical protein
LPTVYITLSTIAIGKKGFFPFTLNDLLGYKRVARLGETGRSDSFATLPHPTFQFGEWKKGALAAEGLDCRKGNYRKHPSSLQSIVGRRGRNSFLRK